MLDIAIAKTKRPRPQCDAHVQRRSAALASAERLARPKTVPASASGMDTLIREADQFLQGAQSMGPTASATPTRERLLKAGEHAHMGVAVDTEGSAAIVRPQVKFADSPLDVLAKRKRLDPDRDRAAAMLRAARRYEALWRKAGLAPLKGQDPGKIRSTATGSGICGTEAKQEAWDLYGAASAVLGDGERKAVQGAVLYDEPLDAIGRRLARFPTGDRTSAIAIATYDLRNGLERLAVHFGYLEAETGPAAKVGRNCIVAEVYPVLPDLPPEMAALLGAMDAREARGA